MSFKLPRSHFAGAAAARARTTFISRLAFSEDKKGDLPETTKNGIYQFEPKKEKFDTFYQINDYFTINQSNIGRPNQ
jgi:hypothetical protein